MCHYPGCPPCDNRYVPVLPGDSRITFIKLETMKQLLFGNPVFENPGVIMTTCRSGDKWFVDAEVGDEVELCDVNGTVLGKGIIVFQYLDAFACIPEIWFKLNHDPSCRTESGLYEGMNAAYPHGWNVDEVTTLGFIRV